MKAVELYQDIQNLSNLIYQINKRDHLAIEELNRLHLIVFNSKVEATCSNCHIKAYKKLISLTIEELKEMESQKFKIKEGVRVEYPVGTHYTSTSGISNDVAVKYLEQFPKLIKNFSVYPGSDSESKELDLKSLKPKQEKKKEETKKD